MPIKKLTKALFTRSNFRRVNIIRRGLSQLFGQAHQSQGRLTSPIRAKTLSRRGHQGLIQLPIPILQLVTGQQTVVTMAPQPLDQGLHLRKSRRSTT